MRVVSSAIGIAITWAWAIWGSPAVFRHPSEAIRRGVIYMPPDRKKEGLWLEHDSAFNIGSVIVERMPFDWLHRDRLAKAAAERLKELE